MNYYQPKFPKGKLHEVVTKYIDNMEKLGREPNCEIGFDDGRAASGAAVRGWLLRDPQAGAGAPRYVLLNDGDVWREVEAPATVPGEGGVRTWLNAPDDDIVLLLNRSLANARMGGPGFLEAEEQVQLHVVGDRRGAGGNSTYHGSDRRRLR